MGYVNLADCVRDLEAQGQLIRIDEPVDPCLEIGAIQRRAFARKSPALLFTKPKGCAFSMLANLFGTRERLEYIFRDSLDALHAIFRYKTDPASLLRKPFQAIGLAPRLLKAWAGWARSAQGSVQAPKAPVLAHACNPAELPRLVCWPGDGGPYITLPLVYSEDPANPGDANLGMYRVQLAGNSYERNEAGMHYQLKRGLGIHHAHAISGKINLPVHVYVGGPPALTLAAIMPLPEGMNELLFASLLGNARIRKIRHKGFALPVLADCDFLLQGEIGGALKPEGPFGDHLGYYSLRHDFPVFRIHRVFHRDNAIWPFTTVGRPPQEDTVFGDFIHELTGPLVSSVFPGVKEVRAVDAAGVHPLLLAVGEDRYTPYEAARKPRELFTLAMHLLGVTQTALAKYLLICSHEDAPGLSARDARGFFTHMLERADFANDLHFITRASCDTLDYTGTGLNEGSKLIWASTGCKRRQLGHELTDFPPLPPGYKNPVVVSAGILAIAGMPHRRGRGETDEESLGPLLHVLEKWSGRENFPLVVVCDDSGFCAQTFENFLWVAFTRSDPATDTYGAYAAIHAKHWACQAPLVIDARSKAFHAPPLAEDGEVVRRLEKLGARGGPLWGII